MSRSYRAQLTVEGISQEHSTAVLLELENLWEWSSISLDPSGVSLVATGVDELYGDETASTFSDLVANTVNEANRGPCDVRVELSYLG